MTGIVAVAVAAPCRYCGVPAYLSDENGSLHPCCRFWIEEQGATRCVACAASRGRRENNSNGTARRADGTRRSGRSPIARTEDPTSSHVAASAIEPKRDTRKAKVLDRLRAADGGWVDGNALYAPDVGGSEGLRRLRELANDGWQINKRPNPTSDTAWQYRLIGKA